jgi:ABC-type nitrate/sulfonate/bicarbonate transport system substrate-binding protein
MELSRKHGWVVAILILLSVASMTGCQQMEPKDEVTIKTAWVHTVEWSGFYAAQEKGYYADENLKVNLVPGRGEPIEEVASGEIEFGTSTGTGLVLARKAGEPVKAVATVMRQSPLVVLSLADSGITRPEDLAGKTVSVASPDLSTGWDVQLLTLLEEAGIDREDVNLVSTGFGIDPLLTGEIDAMGFAWSANGGMEAQLAGHDVNMIFMSDYGILEYPNAIFTTEQMIEENPDVIERFVRATLKGYQYAIENPDEVVEFALERNDSLDPELQAASMDAFVPLIDSGDAPIGWMDAEVWQSTQSILVDQAFIDSPVEPSLLYTNEFVEAAQ